MSTETNIITLESLNVENLPELQGLKDKQLELVKDCPYVEITDNSTYETAKKHRTALLKGRTTLEGQEKIIVSKLSTFRKQVGEVTKGLIDITLPHETKQQEEVKRYEEIKEKEKKEKERIEAERVEAIKNKIDQLETECYSLVNSATIPTLESTKKEIDSILNCSFDFQEFDYNLTLAKNRIETSLKEKIASLEKAEQERQEKIRLQKEKEEAQKKADELQAQIDAQNKKAEEERLAREKAEKESKELADKKAKEEKDKVFEVRKNRLAEIEVLFDIDRDYFRTTPEDLYNITKEDVYNADVIDFENILTDAKKSIQDAKYKHQKERLENRTSELLKIGFKHDESKEYSYYLNDDKLYVSKEILSTRDDNWFNEFLKDSKLFVESELKKAEIEAKKKADQENKERVKRLSKDKAIYKNTLKENLGSFPVVFDADQKEVKEFSEHAANKVNELYNQLLTELENL